MFAFKFVLGHLMHFQAKRSHLMPFQAKPVQHVPVCVSGGLCSVRDYKKSVQPLSTGQTVTVGVEYMCTVYAQQKQCLQHI